MTKLYYAQREASFYECLRYLRQKLIIQQVTKGQCKKKEKIGNIRKRGGVKSYMTTGFLIADFLIYV